MPEYQYFASQNNCFDLNIVQRSGETIRFHSIADLRYEACLIQHDLRPFQLYRSPNLLDSDSYAGFLQVNGVFDSKGKQFERIPQAFDAENHLCGAKFSFAYDLLILQKYGLSQTWDSIDAFGGLRRTSFCWKHDLLVAVRTGYRFPFDSKLILNPSAKFRFKYDILKLYRERISSHWNAIPCDFLAKQNIRFNSNRREIAVFPIRRQSLVRPGWKIFARNLLSEEVTELGFIDAGREDRLLSDLFLPDGEYEISVLTSSLFWKEAADLNVRTIVVGPDMEISPLPTIYNLRSSVQNGTTIIQWSASKSEVENCLFGVWCGSDSPVDTDRPPDATVWYSSLMMEYQTSFSQNAPAYAAVAAIRPGNESEKGKVHQLYLDWSNTPPRAPDDIMVLPEALPAFDPEITERTLEQEDLALVF